MKLDECFKLHVRRKHGSYKVLLHVRGLTWLQFLKETVVTFDVFGLAHFSFLLLVATIPLLFLLVDSARLRAHARRLLLLTGSHVGAVLLELAWKRRLLELVVHTVVTILAQRLVGA